ncbi:hypothetical protein R3P38DRAFT_2796633 [Favolaschia claudopus]|uniref:DUF6533 domain-containing protein n=1 Tax=Favolaschia claudopus TaxID=2862362 RepID=A0AAW0A3R0_9AGAR
MSSPPTQTVSDLFTSAAASLIIYDHLLTLGDEIKLVWPHRTRLPKLLFFLSRYMIPAIEFCMWLSSDAICGYWHVAPLYIAMAAAEALIFCSQCKTVTKGIDERSQWMWWALVLMYSANLITVTFCVSEVIPAAGSGKDSCVLPEKPALKLYTASNTPRITTGRSRFSILVSRMTINLLDREEYIDNAPEEVSTVVFEYD